MPECFKSNCRGLNNGCQVPAVVATPSSEHVVGIDVSSWNPSVDWTGLKASFVQFSYIKNTEGTSYVSLTFAAQRSGALQAGMLVGSYHYARPAASSGAAQAAFFVANGGGWRADARTLPGAVDLEKSESEDPCHGLTKPAMVTWLHDFSHNYHRLTGRLPVIYATTDHWQRCIDSTELKPNWTAIFSWVVQLNCVPGRCQVPKS